MKKLSIITILLILTILSYAQPRIGLSISPSITSNRVHYSNDNENLAKEGSALRMKFGLEADFQVADNYSFTTGMIYAPKRVGITYANLLEGGDKEIEHYKLQYLQIPAAVKMFTNEITPDLKSFFQLGFLTEIKLFSTPENKGENIIEEFNLFDFSFLGGIGLEYGAGINTIIYGGIFYERGLVNIVKHSHSKLANDNLAVRMTTASIKVGLKF